MQYLDRIDAIKSRAEANRLTLHGLCAEAGVDYATLHRWVNRQSSPRWDTTDRILAKLEKRLDAIEAETFARLAPDFLTRPLYEAWQETRLAAKGQFAAAE